MKQGETAEIIKKANCILELDKEFVGIKFLFTQDEFDAAAVRPLIKRVPYCILVKSSMAGHAWKGTIDNFGCMGAARALGLIEPDERFISGRNYLNLGLYKDLVTAKNVCNNASLCNHKAYGIMVKPVKDFIDEEPDVVIIVSNSYNIMRLVQGYTYSYGAHTAYKMIGNQAFCSECTAYPFENNDINISMLCSGTRAIAKWSKTEIALGIPFNKFACMIDGVCNTINPIEPNEEKFLIERKLKENNYTDITIEYDKNYYTGCYLK